MKILQLTQNTQEWHQHRATARNASDASAMMACSPYKTRAQLLQERATGIKPDVDAATQARFDRGHEIEAQARAIAEEMLEQELFPVIGTTDDGYLSASFDGITMDETVVVEIKSWNESKAADIRDGKVPEADRWQVVQQLVVSGADACMYIVTDGTRDKWEWLTVHLTPEDEAALLAGWEQFEKDVAAYVPTEPVAPVVAAPMESLPAVSVRVDGQLAIVSNLPAFGQALRDFIERIPAKPATDQQFVDAEAACKALKKAEDALDQAEDGALAQISDVELMRRTVADLKNLARTTRLATEKLVKAEKDARRTERVMAARQAFDQHVAALQLDIKGVRLIVPTPDFGGAIKGLSSLASIDDKLTAALIAGKAEANTLASRIAGNLQTLDSVPQYAHLFADRQELAYKDYEVLELLMQKRVDAEAARIEAERERIRQEEVERLLQEELHKAKLEQLQRGMDSLTAQHIGEVAAEIAGRAKHDTDPRFAAVVASAPAPADETPTLTLGVINERLHPISVSAAGSERQSYRDSDGMPTERAVLEREWRRMKIALSATAAQPPADGALNTIAAMFHSGEEIEGPDGLAMMVDMSVWNDALDAFEGIIGDEMEPAKEQA